MALDTRAKRASAVSFLGWGRVPGVDNTSLDEPERVASVWSYNGISISGAAPVTVSGLLTIWDRRRRGK